jgi:hypothetical protein
MLFSQVAHFTTVKSSTAHGTKITILRTKTSITRRSSPYRSLHHVLTFNSWAFLGLGFTIQERTEGADRCPYLSEEAIDPKWMEEVIKSGALVANRKM